MNKFTPRFLLVILVFLSLACQFSAANRSPNVSSPPEQLPLASAPPEQLPGASNPSNQQANPIGFSEVDCNASGVTFKDISVDYIVDDIYDGPYLACNVSTTGSHELSETAYISVTAYKTGKLDEFYQSMKENIAGFVDQANEWNAQADIPESAKDTITFIRNDSEGYIFLISKEANVQGCYMGDGYGAEKINGKYLVQLQFSSCEGDAGTYLATMQELKTAAEDAIKRVEASAQP